MRSPHRRWLLVGSLAAAACSGGAQTAAPSATPAPASATTQPAATTTTSTTEPATTTTSSTTTTTTTTTTTSTTTTTTSTTTTEPARSRPTSRLIEPWGFAFFKPLPAWEGETAFTGVPAGPDITNRPALAVKIDNAPGGRPQWNLADADLVFEENVEGVTRFIAVFQSRIPDRIGPVRSARTSDINVLAGLNRPILAWSGGNFGVTLAVEGAHIYGWLSNLSAQKTSCFWRSGTRNAPHNLMLDPWCALDSETHAGPARPVFMRDPVVPGGGSSDGRFGVRMSGVDVSWQWDAQADVYRRSQNGRLHVDYDGDPVTAANVVVLRVDYQPSEADERSPEAITVGSGSGALHRDGKAYDITWSRSTRFDGFTLTAADGSAISIAPGTTFVELARA